MKNNKVYFDDIIPFIDDILEMEYDLTDVVWDVGVDPEEGAYIHIYGPWDDTEETKSLVIDDPYPVISTDAVHDMDLLKDSFMLSDPKLKTFFDESLSNEKEPDAPIEQEYSGMDLVDTPTYNVKIVVMDNSNV